MNWGYSSRSIAVAAAILVAASLSQFAYAQTPPEPQPKPSSSSCGEDGLQSCETPPPFHSTFNGDKDATSSEATDFNNLVALDDAMEAALDALHKAQSCGTQADVIAANLAWNKAYDAYTAAANQYVENYSTNIYPKGGPPFSGPGAAQAATLFDADRTKVANAVFKAGKHGHAKASDCPATPKKAAVLEDILGHVSIGVGIGVGGGHDRGGEGHPQSSRNPSSSTPRPTNETTPSPQD